jgi:dTDP-4-amino-4,6-dideoxygalactose transaminase
MKSPLFYSLPPAGQKISAGEVIRCIHAIQSKNGASLLGSIKRYLGCEHLYYLSSGRAALWLALKAFSRSKPDRNEVLIPAYSCPSVVSAVLKAGLIPKLCDINLSDFGFCYDELIKKLNDKTLAVIVVHLYGAPAEVSKIKNLCNDNKSYLMEDAAQAFGNCFPETPDIKLGLAGDAGFYSFGRGKPLNIMHGGLLAIQSQDAYRDANIIYSNLSGCARHQKVNYCVSLGMYSLLSNPYLYWLPQMIPFLNLGGTVFEPEFVTSKGLDLAAALAGIMIESIEKEKNVRRDNSKWYAQNLGDICANERQIKGDYPYLRYPLLIQDANKRKKVLEMLSSKGTGATGSYPTPLNALPGLDKRLMDKSKYKNAEIMSESIITLPVHSMVTATDREKIKRIARQAANEG